MFYVGEGDVQPCNFMMVPNLWIPNTQTLYKPVPLSIPKTSVNVPISSGRRLLGIRDDVGVLYLSHQYQKISIPQVLLVFHHAQSYFYFDTLELVGTSHERVTGSAQNHPKILGSTLDRERKRIHSEIRQLSSSQFIIGFEELTIKYFEKF